MGVTGNFNMEDPNKQEKIRRGSHEYVPGAGKHGTYVEKPYLHQGYPKVMGSVPAPMRSAFAAGEGGNTLFEEARKAWDDDARRNTVNSKPEEEAWLSAHAPKEAKAVKTSKVA